MQQPASAQDVERAWEDNTLAQVLYHDWEAQTYDEKWSISFDERCTAVVRDRFERVVRGRRLPGEEVPYGRALSFMSSRHAAKAQSQGCRGRRAAGV